MANPLTKLEQYQPFYYDFNRTNITVKDDILEQCTVTRFSVMRHYANHDTHHRSILRSTETNRTVYTCTNKRGNG